MGKRKTQQQKIITIMCQNSGRRWWFPYDFMKPEQGELFVGYEASARLSELAKEYPDMIESQRDGKYIKRRMRFEVGKSWFWALPKDLRATVNTHYRKPEPIEPYKPKQGSLL